MFTRLFSLLFVLCAMPTVADQYAWQKLIELTDSKVGIGARPAGTKKEKSAADWIKRQWQLQGYQVVQHDFTYSEKQHEKSSSNLSITIPGESSKTLIIAAHYDSTGDEHGSLGTIDNGSGVAAILSLAKRLKGKELPYKVRLIAFGAEEVGLHGSYTYVNQQQNSLTDVFGMINLDTIIGGDNLYIHSATQKPYSCQNIKHSKYNADDSLRNGLIRTSTKLFGQRSHTLHPANSEFATGETGSWSDHAAFACRGIPVAYLEATNFAIDGKSGHDGYSQSTHPATWDCFDERKITACNKNTEQKWGKIWHTEFDRIDKLKTLFEQRLYAQLGQNVDLLEAYILKQMD
jgi:hypothetical protein